MTSILKNVLAQAWPEILLARLLIGSESWSLQAKAGDLASMHPFISWSLCMPQERELVHMCYLFLLFNHLLKTHKMTMQFVFFWRVEIIGVVCSSFWTSWWKAIKWLFILFFLKNRNGWCYLFIVFNQLTKKSQNMTVHFVCLAIAE